MNQIQLSKKVEISQKGLIFRSNLSFKEWAEVGQRLRMMEGSVQFWIGDWLNYGEHTYKEWSQEFDPENKISYGYLRNMKYVASRIPLSRRRDKLSWSHHQEVAELEPEDQELLFNEMEKYKMTRSQVRRLVYTYKKKLEIPEMTEAQIEKIQIPHEDFEAVQSLVMACADILDMYDRLNLEAMRPNARDYLLSAMRDIVRKFGIEIVKYDKKE